MSSTPGGTGRVEASLTGAQAGPVQISSNGNGNAQGGPKSTSVREIIVTIDKVTAHSSSAGWVTLSTHEVTVDLLKLAQFVEPLGFKNIPPGKVTQLRLYVKEGGQQYVTREDGQHIDLKVPSGIQSGIKIKGDFDVNACEVSGVSVQMDGKKSIWVHPTGQEDLWILRPVIRLGRVEATGVGCDPGSTTPGGAGGGYDTIGGGGTGGGSGSLGGGPGTGGAGGGDFMEGGIPTTPGTPNPSGSGTPCALGSSCLSGICQGGVCLRGGPDSPCGNNADCFSNACTSAGTCGPGGAVGTGQPCTLNGQCLSSACTSGQCGPGGQGQPCQAVTDCLSGYACTNGYCEALAN